MSESASRSAKEPLTTTEWKIVSPNKLPELIIKTLEDGVWQPLAASVATDELLTSDLPQFAKPEARERNLAQKMADDREAMLRLKRLRNALEMWPDLLPIKRGHGDIEMIDLDKIPDNKPLIDPLTSKLP